MLKRIFWFFEAKNIPKSYPFKIAIIGPENEAFQIKGDCLFLSPLSVSLAWTFYASWLTPVWVKDPGGGYFGVKRIGMTVGNPRKPP